MPDDKLYCSICQRPIEVEPVTGWAEGHNAQPVNNGRCCSVCNDTVVLPARIQRLSRANRRREHDRKTK